MSFVRFVEMFFQTFIFSFFLFLAHMCHLWLSVQSFERCCDPSLFIAPEFKLPDFVVQSAHESMSSSSFNSPLRENLLSSFDSESSSKSISQDPLVYSIAPPAHPAPRHAPRSSALSAAPSVPLPASLMGDLVLPSPVSLADTLIAGNLVSRRSHVQVGERIEVYLQLRDAAKQRLDVPGWRWSPRLLPASSDSDFTPPTNHDLESRFDDIFDITWICTHNVHLCVCVVHQ
jgi:hypothetical protein